MALIITICVVLIAIGIHYEALLYLSKLLLRINIPPRPKVALCVVMTFFAHIVEIQVFAIVFYISSRNGIGPISPNLPFEDFVYFSIINYTSLGYGDMIPVGPLRILAGIEALLGLILITWTASFAFLQMKKFW